MAKRGGQKLGVGGSAQAQAQDMPDSMGQLTPVKGLGGSTGAQLMRDERGKLYVVKGGASEGHVLEEVTADKLYAAMGVDVVKQTVVQDENGRIKKVAEYLDGSAPLSQVLNTNMEGKVIAQLQEGFAVDALMGNWDVIGLAYDNVLVTKSGKAVRVDNGGSLRYRAQGAPKGALFNEYPMEVFSLRSSGMNGEAARVFGSMSFGEIARQASGIAAKKNSIMKSVPADLRDIMGKRIDRMGELGRVYKTLQKAGKSDSWIEGYVRSIWTNKGTLLTSEADILNSI